MTCLFTLMDYLLVKSWIWLFFLFWNTMKYSVMLVVSVFVGPGKTIHRLAASNASRKSGISKEEVARVLPELYNIEKTKVIAWMLWVTFYWGVTIYAVAYGALTNGV